jgi:hypothetical protein
MRSRDLRTRILRGALAGAVGNELLLLFSALSYKLTLGRVPYQGLFLMAVPVYMLVGAVIGAAVGAVVGVCAIKSGRTPGAFARACIGAVCVVVLILIVRWVSAQDEAGLIMPSLAYRVTAFVLTALMLGALPGIAARPSVKRPAFA